MKTLVGIYDYCWGTTENEKGIRKLVEPISTLVWGSILPLYEEKSKVGVAGQKILIQEPSPYLIKIPVLEKEMSLRGIVRDWYIVDREDLDIFRFNTIKSARFYNPQEFPEIQTLFTTCVQGIQCATKAYPKKLAESGVTAYQALISHALTGQLSQKCELSDLELRIKNLWTMKELDLINQQIATALEKRKEGRDCTSDIHNISGTLDAKAKEFFEILQQFKEDFRLTRYLAQDEPTFPCN